MPDISSIWNCRRTPGCTAREISLDNVLKLILELYRAARETPTDEFQELALSMIRSQLSFPTAMWGSLEMSPTKFVMNSVHLHNEGPEILQDWAALHLHDPSVDKVVANAGRAQIVFTPEAFQDNKAMLDFTQRYGHLNNLIAAELSQGGRHGQLHAEFLALYRADRYAHFGAADQLILDQLLPHLVEARAINRMLTIGPLADGNPGLAGTRALVRPDGTLYHCGARFAGLLHEAWPALKDGRLPAELLSALLPGGEVPLPDRSIAVAATPLGSMLLLSIRRISPLHKLSRRELMVASLFGQGKSHKEIAKELNIAPSTARNFLSTIYKKLGINSKAELARITSEGFSAR